ncbi:hypothetical protein ACFQJ8_23245 [Halocatena marina]|uniref:hypothetical protein n=1 Tax=Halocatena marina TaxID=2934937 RepID=UPI0036063273
MGIVVGWGWSVSGGRAAASIPRTGSLDDDDAPFTVVGMQITAVLHNRGWLGRRPRKRSLTLDGAGERRSSEDGVNIMSDIIPCPFPRDGSTGGDTDHGRGKSDVAVEARSLTDGDCDGSRVGLVDNGTVVVLGVSEPAPKSPPSRAGVVVVGTSPTASAPFIP